MLTTSYNSVHPSLFEATWQEFSKFLSKYQWAFDHPSYSPRKTEIIYAILNRGKPGCCTFLREGGHRFILPVLHVRHFEKAINGKLKIYYVSWGQQVLLYFDIDLHHDWQTQEQGDDAKRLLNALLRDFFGQEVLFWSNSSRGFNGYLKVNLQGMNPDDANKVFARLEKALQLFLAYCGNLADFEIKGRVGFIHDGGYHWAQYGKLPIHCPDWNFARLKEFKSTPMVAIHRLEALCLTIEQQAPLEVLERHKALKKSKGAEPRMDGDWFLVTPEMEEALQAKYGEGWRFRFMCQGSDEATWLHKHHYRPGQMPESMTTAEFAKKEEERRDKLRRGNGPKRVRGVADEPKGTVDAGASSAVEAVASENHRGHQGNDGQRIRAEGRDRTGDGLEPRPCQGVAETGAEDKPDIIGVRQNIKRDTGQFASQRVNLDFADLMDEPDSFERQKGALFRYARYLKRVPTQEEGIQLIHDHKLFSGSWRENLDRRTARVRDILKWIAGTFDASKCAKGTVNVGKYDAWAAKKFPKGLVGGKRRYVTEEGEIIEFHQNIHVSAKFIAVFMAVAEFALLINKNQDDSLPHNRAEELWNALYAKSLVTVRFCARKWAVCRELLVEHGIIAITDRDYSPGKAMKWAVARFFPGLGLWKGVRRPGLLGPGCLPKERIRTREQEHNTWLHSQPAEKAILDGWLLPRPPPDRNRLWTRQI